MKNIIKKHRNTSIFASPSQQAQMRNVYSGFIQFSHLKFHPSSSPLCTLTTDRQWRQLVKAASFTSELYNGGGSPTLEELFMDEGVFKLVSLTVEVMCELHLLDIRIPDLPALPATAEMWRRYIAEKDASELGLEAFDDCDEEIRDAVAKVAAVQNDSAEFTETCLTLTRSYEDLISRLFSQGQDPDLALHLAESHIGRTYACVGRALGWFTSLAPGTMLSVNIHQGRVWQKR